MIFLFYHRRPCYLCFYRVFFTGSHNRKTCQWLTFFSLLLLSHRNVSIQHKNSPFRLRNRFYRRFRTNAETSHHYPIRQKKISVHQINLLIIIKHKSNGRQGSYPLSAYFDLSAVYPATSSVLPEILSCEFSSFKRACFSFNSSSFGNGFFTSSIALASCVFV